jgi:hypothetical protein
MKKSTKTAKTPAPATKLTAPAPARKSAAAPRVKKAAAPASAPAAVVTKPKGARVTLIAKVDVGFGNALYVRGSGAGLSWDKGIALENVANDTWSVVLPAVETPFTFKVLVNDSTWSQGDDFTAAPGETVTVTPSF